MPAAEQPAPRSLKLHTVSDDVPGIRRNRRGQEFVYCDFKGRPVRDRGTLARIRSLAIPPAWTAVWICPEPKGHIQATGRDARGRKQYRYHPDWVICREAGKTDRLTTLAAALPTIRRRVRRDLSRSGMPREKVLALMVRLVELTAIRPGHREYARTNHSYGLATMQDGHATIKQQRVDFSFSGKGGKQHLLTVDDPKVSRLVRRCRDLRGRALFQYEETNGRPRAVHATDLNAYLKAISGADVTAKDLRTWSATILACRLLRRRGQAASTTEAKRNVKDTICAVAEHLGNTPAICRKSYIHDAIIQAYGEGKLPLQSDKSSGSLSPVETLVRNLIQSYDALYEVRIVKPPSRA